MIPSKQSEAARLLGKPVKLGQRSVRLAGERTASGFPSPAEEYLDQALDLNELLVQRPEATYFLRVSGDSMSGAGIRNGDILVVDRSLTPGGDSVVVAVVDNEFTVKRLKVSPEGALLLVGDASGCAPIPVTPDSAVEIWGVVLHLIHHMQL